MKQLVIIGGGFAGMWAALVASREAAVADAPLSVTVVSPDAHLTARPRLYEPFTEALRAPFAPVFAPLGIELLLGTATAVDTVARSVSVNTKQGAQRSLAYDRLVLAAGSVQRALNIPGAREFALDVDTFQGAAKLDAHLRRVLAAPASDGALTFAIIGAGFSGVELATEMRNHIRLLGHVEAAAKARVLLIEMRDVVGPELGENPRPHIEAALRETRVETRLGTALSAIEPHAIVLGSGERIACATVIITTGLNAHPLAATLGAEHDGQGRVVVDSHLRVKGNPEVFAAGDVAHAQADDAHAALMSCQHAIPMGKHAGYNAARSLLGQTLRDYSQPSYVTCLDLGDFGALFTTGWDRQTDKVGPEVKAFKKMINTQWIYPPQGDRAALLAAADLDAPWPPAA